MIKKSLFAQPVFLGLAATFLIGLNAVLIKQFVNEGISPFLLAVVRLFSAALAILVIMRASGKKIDLTPKHPRLLFIIAFFGVAANYFFYHWGFQYIPATTAILLESTAPVFSALLIALLFKESLRANELVSVVIAVAGIFLLVFQPGAPLIEDALFGNLLEIIAAITWAVFIIGSKKYLAYEEPLSILFKVFLIAGIILSPVMLFVQTISWEHVLKAVFLGVFTTAIAYYWFYQAIKRLSTISATLLVCLTPVFAVILSALFLKETITIHVFIGGTLVLTSILFSQTPEKSVKNTKKRKKPIGGKRLGA